MKKVTQKVFQCEMIETDEDFVKLRRTYELVKLELKEGKKVKRVHFYERNSTNWELIEEVDFSKFNNENWKLIEI
jgi:hypothetical protein